MPTSGNLVMFILASLALLLVPGPAVLYIFARSVEQGRRAGLISILGIHAATLVHVLAAALGISAIIASSPLAFQAIKYAGAAYLIWIGAKRIFGRAQRKDIDAGMEIHSHARLLRDGFIVNLLNPKTALFFLAFLPQFIDPGRGLVPVQILTLGMVYTALGIVADGSYALAAGFAGNWLKGSTRLLDVERYIGGTLLAGLGVAAAMSGSRAS